MSSARFTSLLPLVFAAALAAQTVKVTGTPTIYPISSEQTIGDERWLTTRVVDAITGEPLPGAEFLLVAESNNPMRGEFWWQMRAIADADGFVRVRVDQQAPGYTPWSWIIVRAVGHGAVTGCESLDEAITQLSPAVPIPVQVLDWQDVPVADALVGCCGGCGHTPDLAASRTDANGLVKLDGIDAHNQIADLYVEHPALDLCYADDVRWSVGEPPLVLRVRPGVPAVGVLVDADGQPITGAYVGCLEVHRGPWTRTANDGTFHLYGARRPDNLHVFVGARELEFVRPRQQPFRLQVPAPNGERVQTVSLPDDQRDPQQPLTIPKSHTSVRIHVEGAPEEARVELRTARAFEDITQPVADGIPIALPAEPFVLALTVGQQQRIVPMTEAQALASAPLVLRWFAPTHLQGHLVDEHGQPVSAHLSLSYYLSMDAEESDSTPPSPSAFDLPTDEVGLRMLLVRPDDNHRARAIPIVLPTRGDDVHVDLGTIQLGGEPQLVLQGADGSPLPAARVYLARRGWPNRVPGAPVFPLDKNGAWLGPDLQRGDAMRVQTDAVDTASALRIVDLDVRFVITTDGPYTLRLPAGELLVTVHDPDGKDLDSAVTIGEQLVWIGPPKLLRRVPPGKQRLFVAAENHQSAIVEVDVPATGRVPIDVVLPPR